MADIKDIAKIYGIECAKPMLLSREGKTEYLLNNEYILGVANSNSLTDSKIVLINKLVDRYRSYGLLAPKYIKNEDGQYIYELNDDIYYVYEYINESLLKDSPDTKYLDINKQLFKYIGDYSQEYKNKDIMPFRTVHSVIDLSPVDSEVDEKQANLNLLCESLAKAGFLDLKNKIIKYNDKIREELKQIYKKLPRCNYHGSLTSRSILVKDNKFVGLTDFDLAGSEVIVNYISNEARADISEDEFLVFSAAEIRNRIINGHKKNVGLILDNYIMSDDEKKALELYNKLLFISGFSYYTAYRNVLRTKNRNKVTSLLYMLIV